MNKSFSQSQLKELISITAEVLHIQYPSIIEKDYYVTSIIHSLSGIEKERYQRFIHSMVYDDKVAIPNYDSALTILENISETAINILNYPSDMNSKTDKVYEKA